MDGDGDVGGERFSEASSPASLMLPPLVRRIMPQTHELVVVVAAGCSVIELERLCEVREAWMLTAFKMKR